jgi:Spy/CpxP family protein refolding chaperone
MPGLREPMLEIYDILTPKQQQDLRERLRPLREQLGIEAIQ